MALAEGVGQDARGAFTLIGVSQNVFFAESLPSQTKRAVMVHLESDGQEDDVGSLRIAFSVRSPAGAVVVATVAEIEIAGRRMPELPGQFDVPTEFLVPVDAFGLYEISAEVTFPDGSEGAATVALHALPVPPR